MSSIEAAGFGQTTDSPVNPVAPASDPASAFGSKAAPQLRLDISISMSASGEKQTLATHQMKLILGNTEIIQVDAPERPLFPGADIQFYEIRGF